MSEMIGRKLIGRFDRGYLIVLAISFMAIWPFISRASLPEGTDAELHIFRLHELSLLVRSGELYPRWAPNFYHGYGYPIFNYYAPLTYYLGLVVELMPRLDAVDGIKAVFVLGLILGALGMYGFVKQNWGKRAGFIAAAVYVYTPYIQYIDPHARGVLPESFSFGLFPVALWALDRVRCGGGKWAWISAVFFTAAIILSHNLMGLLFFVLLFAWAIWQEAISKYRTSKRQKRAISNAPITALILGLGLAAFFWLPVILERDAVNLNTLLGAGDNYDFHTHFLSWREMLSASKWLDWSATRPDFVFNLGLAQWLFGGIGFVMLLARRVKNASQLTFFALSLVVLLFLMLPVSTLIWETIPFLPYFQFPWRLLGAAAGMLAILAGGAVSGVEGWIMNFEPWAERPAILSWMTAVLVAVPILLALPLTQPAPWPEFGDVFTARMSEIEHKGRWLGTTSTSDYVPTTVDIVPRRKGSVVVPIYDEQPPDRVNWATIPDGATVDTEVVTPIFFKFTIDSPKGFQFRLFLFDFPGWQVKIDGAPTQIELGRPEGFIVIPVEAGEHLVEVKFGSTPARTAAWIISGLSLIFTFFVAWRTRETRQNEGSRNDRVLDKIVGGMVVTLTAVSVLLFQPAGWLHYDSPDFVAEPAETAVLVNFGDQVALIGHDLSSKLTDPGEAIHITLYWQAEQPLAINYQVFVHILDANGVLVAQSDKINPGDFPTRQWPMDKYIRDSHQIELPSDLPSGDYMVATGLWVQSEGWRLPVFDDFENQIDDNVVLSSLTVK